MFYFNLAYLIFTIIALLVIGVNIKEHGKSLVGNLLIYSFFGTLFLGAIRLFFALTDAGLIKIDDGTVMVCWHLMFYLTMLTFLISIRALVKIVDLSHTNSLGNPFIPSIILGLLILAVFAIAAPVDQYVKTYFVDTIWDRSGLVHFVAFAFAGFLSYYLYKINKKFEGNIGALSKIGRAHV